jgi:hypothetical protein
MLELGASRNLLGRIAIGRILFSARGLSPSVLVAVSGPLRNHHRLTGSKSFVAQHDHLIAWLHNDALCRS